MKKLTLLLLVVILLTACGPKPQDVVNSWQAALNKGDIDAALSYLADDTTVTIVPPAEGDGIYNGHAEIRGWYETIAAGKGSGALRDCKTEGDTLTCVSTYADEGLKAMGVDFIEGSWAAVIRDGKIQSYTFTITPESLAKFPPPPSTPVEALAGSINDIAGTWWFSQAGIMLEYKADGSYRVFSGSETIDEGTFSFNAGKVTYLTSAIHCADNPSATYEIYITTQDGQPVWLRSQLVGEDKCRDREDSGKGKGKFQHP